MQALAPSYIAGLTLLGGDPGEPQQSFSMKTSFYSPFLARSSGHLKFVRKHKSCV